MATTPPTCAKERDPCAVMTEVCRLVAGRGGRALLVGGWVRDHLLGRDLADYDLEVYGLAPENLQEALEQRYAVDLIGRSFGVLKLKGLPIQISVPRRESKSGPGHRGFYVEADPSLPVAEACRRRDFTINAMAFDPLTGELFDACGGRSDLQARILRHTSEHFVEDPLRVLRGMQLCARYSLAPAPATVDLCCGMSMEDLPAERIFEEWRKLLVLGVTPSLGLDFLRRAGWTAHFPELQALIGCPQDPRWHPEGDVWTHVLHCLDVFARERVQDPWEDLVVGLAVLCHDMGKPLTTRRTERGIRSLGHDVEGEEIARAFLSRLTAQAALLEQVLPLVREHAHPAQLHAAGAGDAAVRRLAQRTGRLDRLVRVARADRLGRPPLAQEEFPAGEWLLERARALGLVDARPAPLIRGRHLVALGLQPGPQFTALLDACFEAQLDGRFQDEEQGLAFLRALLRQRGI